jgi:hypothetical protein
MVTSACEDSGDSDADAGPTVDAGGSIKCIAAGDACTGAGMCVEDPDGEIRCHYGCDVVGEECKMYEGVQGGCYKYEDNWVFACLLPGTAVRGEGCAMANDCELGAQCYPSSQGERCFQVCVDTCDAEGCCIEGTCTDTGDGFELCMDADGNPSD